MNLRLITQLLALLPGLLVGNAAAEPASFATHPAPQLDAAAVVRAQLAALQYNDQPQIDSGIAVTYRFASPGNRSATGDIAEFTNMIYAGYADMIRHQGFTLAPLRLYENEALQRVQLITAGGESAVFDFFLSRQDDSNCAGCWFTDAVIRVTIPAAESRQYRL